MDIFILSGLVSFLMLYFWKTNSYKIIQMKKLLVPLLAIVFILFLIFLSDTCVKAASRGLTLWLNIVFPSLFPFFVASELLKGSSLIKAIGVLIEPIMYPLFRVPGCGSFAFLMGTTSGYPVGAKITSSLRKEKMLSKVQAERLLAFSNNSGPLFIVGAVAVGMFSEPKLGPFLLICHIAASITIGILFRFYGNKSSASIMYSSRSSTFKRFKKELFNNKNSNSNLGGLLGEAIKNSIMTILAVGGFIIVFSVIINILLETGFITQFASLISAVLTPLNIDKEIITSLLSGFFEITTGTKMASSIQGVSLAEKLVPVSIIIGWAGLSVHSQVLSIISNTDISLKPYLIGKLLHGIIAGIYTFIGIKIAGSYIFTPLPAFYTMNSQQYLSWKYNLLFSLKYLIIAGGCLAIIVIAASITNILCGYRNSYQQRYIRK